MNNYITINIVNRKVKLIHINEKISLPSNIQGKIDDYWEKRLEHNAKLRRGKIFCIRDIVYKSDEIIINLVDTDYAHYLYTLNNTIEKKYACRVCFAVGLIITSDDKYIIGQMNKETATPLRLQLPGGGLEERDIINGEIFLKDNLDRELKEEMGFSLNNNEIVSSSELKYIKQGGDGGFVAFIYKIKITLSGEEYCSFFKKYCNTLLDKPELCRIFLLDRKKKEINKFFHNVKDPVVDYLNPVILADIEER